MNKFDQDVRYQGVVFQGTMDAAIAQAKAAPDFSVTDRTAHAPALAARSNVIPFRRKNV